LVLDETLTYMRTVRALMEERQSSRYLVRLERLASMLSTVVGEIAFNEGYFTLARQWYSTARHAASAAGDVHLADCALAGLAYLDTYSDNPRGVVRLLEARLESQPSPTPVVAWLWAFVGKAHAALGHETKFLQSMAHSRKVLDLCADDAIEPGVFSFRPEKLDFYEAAGFVQLRKSGEALESAGRALQHYDTRHSTTPALIRLEQASAIVLEGDLDEGCRRATDALLTPQTHPGVTVVTRALKFSAVLGDAATTEAERWRQVLNQVAGARLDMLPAQGLLPALPSGTGTHRDPARKTQPGEASLHGKR
jgi:hypothetical protein